MTRWALRIARLCVAWIYLAGGVAARAADDSTDAVAAPPDPASVHVPDLSFVATPSDARNYDEYYYFNKPGVTFATAWNDLRECASYSIALKLMAPVVKFAPLGSGKDPENRFDVAREARLSLAYGVIGSMIVGFGIDTVVNDNRRGNNRRCMGYKGYARYGLTRALWREVNKGKDADVMARLALIASSPPPATEKLDP